MGKLLTANTVMMCPHGGTVTATTSNIRAKAEGGYILRVSDTFTVTGCPFQVPAPSGTKPQPCVTVRWIVTALRVKVSDPVLTDSSVGLCLSAEQIPQGTVSVSYTQSRASGQ
jgi:hypothetical protein